jgi:sulfur carrier protein ThiS
MTLAEIKQQLQKEEKAIARLRHRYPHLSKMTVAEMLAYLNLTQKSELVAYVEQADRQLQTRTLTDVTETVCHCLDAEGIPKNLYATTVEAEKVKKYVWEYRDVVLKVYPCPTAEGWHLSKG